MTVGSRARAWAGSARRRARSVARRALQGWRRHGPVAVSRTARLTVAAVAAYVVARAMFPHTQPLTGPLTALLVVQATLFATLTTGLKRVLSVVSGVVIAVLLSEVVGLTWWSLGAVIAAALVIGQLLRLGEHLLEAPISAMLVLGVSGAQAAAASRVAETLVGAGVGVLINVVFPPPLRGRDAGAVVERVAVEAAEVLERAAAELPSGVSGPQATGWLEDFRRLDRSVERADQAVAEAADSRRLNPRAVGTADTDPRLRSGLDALEHSVVALRALFRSIADGVLDTDGEGAGYTPGLLEAFALMLGDLAASIRAFGALVHSESHVLHPGAEAPLAEAMEALGETRARLTDLLLVDAREDPDRWLLRGSVLAAVERVLAELDVEERLRRRRQWQTEAAERGRATQAVARLRGTGGDAARPPGWWRRW
jgi:hypothetical protein